MQSLLQQQEKYQCLGLVFFKSNTFELQPPEGEMSPCFWPGAQLYTQVGDLPQISPLICSIQISFAGPNEIIVNEFKERWFFPLLEVSASCTVPMGHAAAEPGKLAN